jgi:hypothetical protein
LLRLLLRITFFNVPLPSPISLGVNSALHTSRVNLLSLFTPLLIFVGATAGLIFSAEFFVGKLPAASVATPLSWISWAPLLLKRD